MSVGRSTGKGVAIIGRRRPNREICLLDLRQHKPTQRGVLVKRASGLLVALMLVLAACGGGDEEASETTAPTDNGSGQATATTEPAVTTTEAPAATTGAPTGSSSDEFCQFVISVAAGSDFTPLGLSPQELEDAFTGNLDAINQAAALAPDEIRNDVLLFAQAYGGFVDLLDENNFNFLALADLDGSDPRLLALEDPALVAAGERIEQYCGVDNFIATPPTPPSDPGNAGDPGGGSIGGDVPDDFPAELLPDGANVLVAISSQGASSVTYEIALPADEVIAYYENLLGAAASTFNDPKGALWFTTYEGAGVGVTVTERDATTTDVNVTLG